MKVLFVYPGFNRHADDNPELRECVPMNEYLGSPSLGLASIAAVTPDHWEMEFRDDRLEPADAPTDADLVALSFFTPAATRALALADSFRAQGLPVVAGGIFPTMMPDVVAPHVSAVVRGEGEGSWRRLLADFEAGELKPLYEATEPVALDSLPLPRLDLYFGVEGERFAPDDYPLQISRGCPLACRACAIPGTMGGGPRAFPLEHVLAQLEQLAAHGKRGCLTEDTSWLPAGASRRRMMELLDAVIERGGEAPISYAGTSMPMVLGTTKRTLARARQAGVDMFYLVGGFDPVTMNAFTGQDDRALQRARDCIAKCHDADIVPYTSFLLGGDQDDEGTVDRMLAFCDAVNLQKAEFAIATPYPGTPQWHQLVREDRILTRDWSRYNDANVVFRPARMSPEALQEGYLRLWREFYASRADALAGLSVVERTIQF